VKRVACVVVVTLAAAAGLVWQSQLVWAQRGEGGARAGGAAAGERSGPSFGFPAPVRFTPPPGAVELQYDAVGNLLKQRERVGGDNDEFYSAADVYFYDCWGW
jgi:hypothetical protein